MSGFRVCLSLTPLIDVMSVKQVFFCLFYTIFWVAGFGSGVSGKGGNQTASPPPRKSLSPDQPNPAEPITDQPSQVMGRIGWALRTLLLCKYDLFEITVYMLG